MDDYIIREDAFLALTGDITDCTIEEFIARLRDKLSKLPSVNITTNNDCISRQVVLDSFWKLDIELRPYAIDAIVNMINNLPPVIPLPKGHGKLTNHEWIDFLTEQFDISRTSAKEMLHVMMSIKKEDNFKKQFSGRK